MNIIRRNPLSSLCPKVRSTQQILGIWTFLTTASLLWSSTMNIYLATELKEAKGTFKESSWLRGAYEEQKKAVSSILFPKTEPGV